MSKILGKYKILKDLGRDSLGNECFKVSAGLKEWGEFVLTKVARTESNEHFSFTAQSLSTLSHKNLLHFKVEEDTEYFYFLRHLREDIDEFSYRAFCDEISSDDCNESGDFADELANSERKDDEEGEGYGGSSLDYVRLFECALQILDALKYIHTKGFYHGNLNPSNILLDGNNRVFLLDFGRSYFYAPLVGSTDSKALKAGLESSARFYAPEQLGFLGALDSGVADSRAGKESDIFSFGLCMLKLLLDAWECDDLDSYTKPQDLDSIFESILSKYELDSVEKELLSLVKQCCAFLPEKRSKLHDLERELRHLYDSVVPKNVYELRCQNEKTLERYADNNDLDSSDMELIKKHIQERIRGHRAYARQFEEKNKKSREPESKLEFAINDLVFICSAVKNSDSYLWVLQVRENESTRIEKIISEGVELVHWFSFTVKGWHNRHSQASNIGKLKRELEQLFKQAEFERERKGRIDKTDIVSEEELLKAEKRDIDEKKQTKLFQYIGVKTGADELTFKLIEKDSGSAKSSDETADKEAQDSTQDLSKESKQEQTQDQAKAFKPKEDVIIQESSQKDNLHAENIKGVVKHYNPATKELTIKLKEKYGTLGRKEGEANALDKKKTYAISYDYQVREILWSKRNKALEDLQEGRTQIPNLLRKINAPIELKENKLRDIESYFNKSLDENQQEAVRKALSLESDCEILLIQGPPGTGKTTTITEIVKQYQKLHKHYKILITSQSNQAVDNVLEKIATSEKNPKGDDKLFRIGNEENITSEIAKSYTPQKVIDKILKENLERIKNNPIKDSNPNIQEELKSLQEDFKKRLQTLSSVIEEKSQSKKGDKKSKEQEVYELFTKDIRLFFGTLLGISSWKSFRDVEFDVAIVDEAGRATPSELLVPCIKARRIILVGDHRQLAPVVDDDVVMQLGKGSKHGKKKHLSAEELEKFNATKKDVTTSLFERLFGRIEGAIEQGNAHQYDYLYNFKHMLTYNYRAHKSICDLYSKAFYEGKLQTKEEISAQKMHNVKVKVFEANAVWFDTSKRSDKEDTQKGTGKINHCNASVILNTLKVLKEKILESQSISDIGIITPYKAQAALLNSKLKNLIDEYKNSNIRIDIGTVDSFQGSDRDMIIYDCVRSSKVKNTKEAQQQRKGSKIDFIADEKRLNVSLSRAKKLLLIVGDKDYLKMASVSEGENPFTQIIVQFEEDTDTYQIQML